MDVLDLETLERVTTIPAPFGVRDIRCTDEPGLLFTVSHFRGVLAVIDVETKQPKARLPFGALPRGKSRPMTARFPPIEFRIRDLAVELIFVTP